MVAGIRTGTISIGFSGWTARGVLPRSDLGQRGDRILITPFDKAVVPAIVRALNEARLNAYALNPSTASVSVPPISEEERAEIARHAKKLGGDDTVAVRAIRQEARQWIEVSGGIAAFCPGGDRCGKSHGSTSCTGPCGSCAGLSRFCSGR
jgi:ribosome recycling factor